MGKPFTSRCSQLETTDLRSKAFWLADDFDLPWVTDFEKGFLDVREELLALRGRERVQVRKTFIFCFSPQFLSAVVWKHQDLHALNLSDPPDYFLAKRGFSKMLVR